MGVPGPRLTGNAHPFSRIETLDTAESAGHNIGVVPLLWIALFGPSQASPAPDLQCGKGAPLVIETEVLPGVADGRSLILWMCSPVKHEDEIYDHLYTCPDYTRGHFYQGETWLSLIDQKTTHVINTIPIHSDWTNEKTFDIPYRIQRFFYAVQGPLNKYGEGKPKILSLKDYNGDGEALEFALFEAENCTIVKTSLYGYSRSRDRVIQYPLHLVEREGATVTVRDSPWLDRFMLQKPVGPGHWRWQYQYHVGGLTHFDIHYDRDKEMFEGEIDIDQP